MVIFSCDRIRILSACLNSFVNNSFFEVEQLKTKGRIICFVVRYKRIKKSRKKKLSNRCYLFQPLCDSTKLISFCMSMKFQQFFITLPVSNIKTKKRKKKTYRKSNFPSISVSSTPKTPTPNPTFGNSKCL